MSPKSHPGLLGVCLSGAGPTILALATHNFDSIAETIVTRFAKENIKCEWKILEPAEEGTTVIRSDDIAKPEAKEEQMTYAGAGVSIHAGNELVDRIKASVKRTKRSGADAEIGGFGGAIDLHAAGFENGPIIVQAIDGVGTKLKIAFAMNKHDTVGIDLVAMNVNDLVVQGAEPISFLDYYASGKLDVEVAASFVEGVANGCKESGCALVGGETAEMPDMYSAGEYDAAGQATGVVRRGQKLLPFKDLMVEGDLLLGLASNGVHSNGFSLVRKVLEKMNLSFHDPAPWDPSTTVGASLLTPTKIYVKSCLELSNKGLVKGMAHITGGGLLENIPRMLPKHLTAEVDIGTWAVPPVFQWLKTAGNVSPTEFARVWNTGIGMVLVIQADKVEEAVKVLEAAGETVARMGRLVTSSEGCVLKNLESWQ
jgi:homoserine kinase